MELLTLWVCIVALFARCNGEVLLDDLTDCLIDLSALESEPPFVLLAQNGDIVRPIDENFLRVSNGTEVVFDCHRALLESEFVEFPLNTKSIDAVCSSGAFLYKGKKIDAQKLSCFKYVYPDLTRTQEKCSPVGSDGRTTELYNLITIKIGFNFTRKYHPLITVCHDEKNYGTIWTHHKILGRSIEYRDKSSGRPTFRTNLPYKRTFYPFASMTKVNSRYSKKNQVIMMKDTLHTNNTITVDGEKVDIIDSSRSSTHYFSKGHLSPDADFIHVAEQDATYFFFNVAPQFQAFNNRNWKTIEYSSREYAEKFKRDIHVYTGTHEILTYPNDKGIETNIYIFNFKKYIPAPRYFWKVLYDPVINAAIAFIGSNDIYLRKTPEGLCTSICDQTSFNEELFVDFKAGYVLCCKVEELRETVLSLPDLSNGGIWPSLLGGIKLKAS